MSLMNKKVNFKNKYLLFSVNQNKNKGRFRLIFCRNCKRFVMIKLIRFR